MGSCKLSLLKHCWHNSVSEHTFKYEGNQTRKGLTKWYAADSGLWIQTLTITQDFGHIKLDRTLRLMRLGTSKWRCLSVSDLMCITHGSM